MAQLEALNIQLTADVKGLSTNLKVGEDGIIKFSKTVAELEVDLKAFKETLKKSTDPAVISKLNKEIEETGQKIKAVKGFGNDAGDGLKKVKKESEGAGDGLTKFSKGSGAATQATINLGRVLQDAPFGFIGIANNLNPLLESFGSLAKSSGGLKGALSALGSSMLGAGGIGLALSAFQFFALGGVDAVKKMFGALGDNKAVAEARKEMEEFNKSLKGAESGALATGLKLQSFVDIAKNGQLPLSQRNEALKEANKLLGDHGTKLTLANVATKAITDQTKLYTEALIAQAVAAIYVGRIAELNVKNNDLDRRGIAALLALREKTAQVNAYAGKRSKLIIRESEENKAYQALVAERDSIALQLKKLNEDLNKETFKSTKNLGKLGPNKDPETDSTAKKIQSEADKIAEIVKKLYADINGFKAANKEGLLSGLELDNKAIDAYKNAIQNIGEINPKATVIPKLSLEINDTVIRNLFQKEGARLANEKPYEVEIPVEYKPFVDSKFDASINNLGVDILRKKYTDGLVNAGIFKLDGVPIEFGTVTTERLKKEFEKVREGAQLSAEKLNSDIDGILANTFTASLSNFGESLGQLITGKISVGDLFGGLFSVLGQGIQQLGKTLIEYGVLAKIAKTSFATAFKNPVGAIVAGIALTAFGSVVKSAGALKLADGGFVSGKGTSRSDSIPAMLSNGEYVINAAAVRKFGLNNLDKINSLQGFAAGGVIGVPQPYAVPNNNVNISNSGIVVAIEGEFKMRNDMLALAVKKGNKTVSINS